MMPRLAAPAFEPGTVWLVGAGPGDPGLLTLHAAHALAEADVVLHDALVSPDILAMAPRARLEPVGKRAGGKRTPQLRINERLIRLAREGRRVVRLKGGDPLVFGRGGEEALALAAAGVRFRIVPGISAGIGGTAAAGIPITHRGLARSVAFVTGHDAGGDLPADLDWQALARGADVLVLYMGLRTIGAIAARLRAAGRPDGGAGRIRYRCNHAAPECRGDHAGGCRNDGRDDPGTCADPDHGGACRGAAGADRAVAGRHADDRHARSPPRHGLKEDKMPSLPLLPETAPFPTEQILALNRIMSGTSAEQRSWLSGFLAGVQAANAPQPVASAPPARRAPLTILFAHRIRQRRGAGRRGAQSGREARVCRPRAGYGRCHAGAGGRRARTCW